MQELTVERIRLANATESLALLGPQDAHLKLLEDETQVTMVPRGTEIALEGERDRVEEVSRLFHVLLRLIREGFHLSSGDVVYALELTRQHLEGELFELYSAEIGVTAKGKPIRVKTLGQRHYIAAIRKQDIVFGIGPAGTGKTYLAVVMAVNAFRAGAVRRIVLTRPAVEAGESLGFLPGDLQEKVDPYLRPLYDALYEVMGTEQVAKLMERGMIEVAPLAYMRGRTLNDAFVILDEAQNTTPEQMKMFLTRLGFGSKMVITGDVTQIDLPRGKQAGLIEAERLLGGIQEIGFIRLSEMDVVRHSLVQKVIRAYAEYEEGLKG